MDPDVRKSENLLDLRRPVKKPALVKKKYSLSSRTLKTAGITLLLVLAGLFFVTKILKKEDLNSLVVIKSKISKHLILPKNEEPALLTITDTNKISTPFLKKTINGDKLLVYQDAKKVIIYRPSIDRIIDVGPVSIAMPEK